MLRWRSAIDTISTGAPYSHEMKPDISEFSYGSTLTSELVQTLGYRGRGSGLSFVEETRHAGVRRQAPGRPGILAIQAVRW